MKLNVDADNIAKSAMEITNATLQFRKNFIKNNKYFFNYIYQEIECCALSGKAFCNIKYQELKKYLGRDWDIEPLTDEIILGLTGRGFECKSQFSTEMFLNISWKHIKDMDKVPEKQNNLYENRWCPDLYFTERV